MLAARFVVGGLKSPMLRCSFTKVNAIAKPNTFRSVSWRQFAEDARGAKTWGRRRRTLKEMAMEPAGETSFKVGQAAVAGGALCGIGALCYYGLGLAKKPGIIDQSMVWPDYVKQRIQATYIYLGGSLAFTGASAVAVFRSPVMLNIVSRGGFVAMAVSIAALIGTGEFCRSLSYEPGFGPKQMAWILHTSVVGAVIAPICMLGGPILVRAAWYTAGIVGGLSAVAACAPSDKFLNMGGPLAIGLGAVFGASLGSAFLPPSTALGAGLYSIAMYGGLLVFSGLLLYDTQRVVRSAETYPQYAAQPFDPVNASISIYLDVINIFIRIATMLASSNQRK
ncbi:growth hormone-inducible transmembrane protein [Halyomorpha halys]|uniref:growth hormone-inducible transmembrane protein n=1 Tax=Halyomorpha halys TaxID=286706 RepID=UPI0006D518D0|nr:growth hormone-inducible transmembrane protein [Halyomorpha halys]XP_014284813.1 growth hormone-inducible transmembrane protein [Halyomorpha halys]